MVADVRTDYPVGFKSRAAPAKSAPRSWTINGRFLTQSVTGVQRYAREIVVALDRLMAGGHPLARDLKIELLMPPGARDAPQLDAITSRSLGWIGGHVWEQAILPFGVRGGVISLCNTGPLVVPKHVVCIHDLNTRLIPESFSFRFRALYRLMIPALGHTAERIATVSHFSASQIQRLGVAKASKTMVIPNGHEHALNWKPRHSDKTRAVAGPDTIVVFGTGSPNKNVGLLVGLSNKLAQVGLRLAVAGATDLRVFGHSDFEQAAASNVTCLGRLTDSEIAALLTDSFCLAFPSFVEGFGLPPLEAMALGCPVVVSDRTSLPEICSDAALFAAPDRPDEWLATFVRLREDQALRSALIERGLARASHYSWTKSAELYLEAMARSDGLLAVPA